MESLVDGKDDSDRNIKSMIKMLEMVDKPASENAVKWQPPGCGKANFFKITNQILIVHVTRPVAQDGDARADEHALIKYLGLIHSYIQWLCFQVKTSYIKYEKCECWSCHGLHRVVAAFLLSVFASVLHQSLSSLSSQFFSSMTLRQWDS